MTSRERVLRAISFHEPDRVPLDLGGTVMSGIMAHPLDRLRRYLGLEQRPVKVYEVFQMLGEVELDVVERLGIDILPVEPLVQFFGLRRENYKPWTLWDGTEVLVPGQFDVEIDGEGDWLLHNEGDPAQPVEGKMPKGGYYFDMASWIYSYSDWTPPDLEAIKAEGPITVPEAEFLQERAEHLRRETDKALLATPGKTGIPQVGSIPDFLCLLFTNKSYVRDLFAIRTERALKSLELLKNHLADNIDILCIDGFDCGGQNCELFAPELFEELFLPFLREQNDWVHRNTTWKTWYHSCGSITRIIPLLIESHMDILNPVQTSAAGMSPVDLKERFGGKIVFWGGGVDTQKTLPFGTADEVKREVAERIRILAPGGGFVFNPVHNVQAGTPPENIQAAFDTARTAGRYPVTK